MNLAELNVLKTDAYHEPSLRLLADCLPQIVFSCDHNGICDFFNRAGLAYIGLINGAASALWFELLASDDRQRIEAEWQSALAATQTLRTECRLRRHDGIYRWFDLQFSALPGVQEQRWLITASDIHEVVDNRQQLEASHRELRSVFDEAPIAISLEDWRLVLEAIKQLRAAGVTDLHRYISSHPEFVDLMIDRAMLVDTNTVSLKLFRAENREQLTGKSMRWLFDTPDARQHFTELLLMFGFEQPRQSVIREMDLAAFDGTPLRVLSHARERQPGVEPGLVLVSRFDVTEFRQVDEQLARQRTLLERMSSLAKVGGWVYDVSLGMSSWTREMSRIHGFDPGQEVSMDDALRVLDEAGRQTVCTAVQRAIDEAEPYDVEVSLVTPSKERRWIRAQAIPIVRDGKVVRLEAAVQDITERKLAELEVKKLNATLESQVKERTEELDRARHDLQSILDALPTMVSYVDRDLRLQFTNHAYQQRVGMNAAQLQNRPLNEVLHPTTMSERIPAFAKAMRGEAQSFETSSRPVHGPPGGPVQIYMQPDVVDGEVRGCYVLVVDLSSLKQVENALRAANLELEAFAYAVAHDLRAPLRAMNGFSSALLEDCAQSLDKDTQHYADEINKASRRMGDLLDGLLALSRATQGDMHFDRVDFSAMAQSILKGLQQQEPQRQVSWQIAPGMVAYGDARMLEAAMHNLLTNAWKYTGRTPAAVIRVDSFEHDGVTNYRVSDNGAGFDMAHTGRLFKPFQRLHRQDEFIGIGIGLATVKRIVNRHGGEISAAATPGGGAVFSFSLRRQLREST